MNTQSIQTTEITAAVRAANPGPTFFTVGQFPKVEPAFTESSLRNAIFKAGPRMTSRGEIPGNGLLEAGAIVRIGRKVLIHREKFLAHVERMTEWNPTTERQMNGKQRVSTDKIASPTPKPRTPKRGGRAAMGAVA